MICARDSYTEGERERRGEGGREGRDRQSGGKEGEKREGEPLREQNEGKED